MLAGNLKTWRKNINLQKVVIVFETDISEYESNIMVNLHKMHKTEMFKYLDRAFPYLKLQLILSNKFNYTLTDIRSHNFQSYFEAGVLYSNSFTKNPFVDSLAFASFQSYRIVYNKPGVFRRSRFIDLLVPLDLLPWILLVVAILAITFLNRKILKTDEFVKYLLLTLSPLLFQILPNRCKYAYSAWVLCAFLLSNFYLAKLKSWVFLPSIISESKTLDQLLSDNYTIYALQADLKAMQNSYSSSMRTIQSLQDSSIAAGVLKEQSFLLSILKELDEDDYLDVRKGARIHGEGIISIYPVLDSEVYTLVFKQNYYISSGSYFDWEIFWTFLLPNGDLVVTAFKTLQSSGIYQYWMSCYEETSKQLHLKYAEESKGEQHRSVESLQDSTLRRRIQPKKLTLEDSIIKDAFIVWAVSLGISIVTAVSEFNCNRIRLIFNYIRANSWKINF
ncbi:unnamed protein product [Allacma fusca]|uniref:Uncharacterized protein n=1 Tax=Allacma fusca TaxID=39272 RepID=A0A8J2NYS9_9HEXA|nr:unnamed protein product [Allacma fusca]